MTDQAPAAAGAAPARRWLAWALVALVVLVAAAIRLRLLDMPLDRDEGEYAYFGQLILQGVPPYAEAYNFKMPGVYAVYALILALFGQTARGIHTGLLLANAWAVVLVYALGARLIGRVAGVAAAAAYATLSLSPRLFFTSAYAEHFVLLPALGGMLVLLSAAQSRSLGAAFTAGVLFGLAFVVKQSGGAFVALGLVELLVSARAADGLRRRLAPPGALAAGALVPFAVLCLTMLAAGTFASFWFWTITYAWQYASASTLHEGVRNLGRALGQILATSYLLAAAGALGLTALVWDPAARARRRVVGAILVFSGVGTTAGLYFRNQYFVLLLPALALLVGTAVDATRRAAAGRGWPGLARLALVAVGLVPLLHLVVLERAILFTATPLQVARALYGRNPFPEAQEIARYIRERSASGDRIAVVGSEPEIYFYARRRAATGFIYTYALVQPSPYAATMQRQMIAEIEAARPRFVVFVKVWTSWLVRDRSDPTVFRWFAEYQKGLVRVGVVDLVSEQDVRYVWGAEAASYTPRADLWLAVFERPAGAS